MGYYENCGSCGWAMTDRYIFCCPECGDRVHPECPCRCPVQFPRPCPCPAEDCEPYKPGGSLPAAPGA